MKSKSLMLSVLISSVMALTIVYSTAFRSFDAVAFDGQNPPHAVTIAGKIIPESSTTQPDKPIIFGKDSGHEKWGELLPTATFDHAKHNTLSNSLDGKTKTACVFCHHTEQPMPVAGMPYLKRSERSEMLTAKLLEAPNAQPVNSCRHCHYQPGTPKTGEFPPAAFDYPAGSPLTKLGDLLTNDNAYHIKCRDACHVPATTRDPKLNAPQTCEKCHSKKSATATPASTSMITPSPSATSSLPPPTMTPSAITSPMTVCSPTPTTSAATPMPSPTVASTATPAPKPLAMLAAKSRRTL